MSPPFPIFGVCLISCLALVNACTSEQTDNSTDTAISTGCDSMDAAECPEGTYCDETGICAYIKDCAGVPGGLAVEDDCGRCDTDPSNDCTEDCAGVFGGNALEDECGVCNDNPNDDCEQDCTGTWGGEALEDECGTCDEDASNDCVQDCAGVFGGEAQLDACGMCDEDPTNDCVQDCTETWGGAATFDECGVCDDDPTNDCVQDCYGTWGGPGVADQCGICDGDGTSCAMWYLGAPGASCDAVCDGLQLFCEETDLLAIDDHEYVWDMFGFALGQSCNTRETDCIQDNDNLCVAWGAPYMHQNVVSNLRCQSGIPAAPCDAIPVDGNHRRLCPCW